MATKIGTVLGFTVYLWNHDDGPDWIDGVPVRVATLEEIEAKASALPPGAERPAFLLTSEAYAAIRNAHAWRS